MTNSNGARSWRDVRKDARDRGLIDENAVQAAYEEDTSRILAHSLRKLRHRQRVSQDKIAAAMHITQGRVSQIENGAPNLATVEAYVEALGGRTHVVAEFDDGQAIKLS